MKNLNIFVRLWEKNFTKKQSRNKHEKLKKNKKGGDERMGESRIF